MYKFRAYDKILKAHKNSVIYSKQEADDLGIQYRYWRECDIRGEWGLTDDGYVCELLDRQRSRDNYGFWAFSGGVVCVYKTTKSGKPNKYTDVLFNVAPLLTGERKAKKIAEALKTDKAKEIVKAYILSNKRIDVAVKRVIPCAPRIELHKWRTVAQSEEFKLAVKQEILVLLEENGFSRQKTLMLLDEAIGMARDKKDVGSMLRAVENLFDILGFKDKDTRHDLLSHSETELQKLADSVIGSTTMIESEQTKYIGADE